MAHCWQMICWLSVAVSLLGQHLATYFSPMTHHCGSWQNMLDKQVASFFMFAGKLNFP
jgi:hypothetical protein